jgi:hypothetical protein
MIPPSTIITLGRIRVCVCVCVRACVCVCMCVCVCGCDDVFSHTHTHRLIMQRQLEQYTRREVASCLQDEFTDSATKTCVSSLLFFLFFFFLFFSFSFFCTQTRTVTESTSRAFSLLFFLFFLFAFFFAPKTRTPILHDLCFWMRKARDRLRGRGCSVCRGAVLCGAQRCVAGSAAMLATCRPCLFLFLSFIFLCYFFSCACCASHMLRDYVWC